MAPLSATPPVLESSPPLRACLVALNAYPVLEPDLARGVGGIETRAWMFARGLTRYAGAHVQFVVRHTRPPRRDTVEGVRIVPLIDRLFEMRAAVGMCVSRRAGFPWLKVHRWPPSLFWQLPIIAAERALRGGARDPWQPDPRLSAIDADVFCTFGVQTHSATVIESARASGIPAVLMLGSDGDLDPEYTPDSSFVSPYGDRGDVCWRILQEADAIVAQTVEQQQTLRERFGRESVVLANPIDVEEWDAGLSQQPQAEDTAGLQRYALWIGRADAVHKRPQLCVELARLCPEIPFLLVMNPRDRELEVRLRGAAPSNVRFVSSVPFSRMPAVFSKAAMLVNTSLLEGFPNTFLQAGLSRVPIASLQVGERFLGELGCGVFANGDQDRLVAGVKAMWREQPSITLLEQARETIVVRHGLRQITRELASALSRTVDEAHPQQPAS
jgi:hypothetical protein